MIDQPDPTDLNLLTQPQLDGVQQITKALLTFMGEIMAKNPALPWSTIWGAMKNFELEMTVRYIKGALQEKADG